MRKYNFNGMNRDELYDAMKKMIVNMDSRAICNDDEYQYIITKNGNDSYALYASMDGYELDEESLTNATIDTVLHTHAFTWLNGLWTVE